LTSFLAKTRDLIIIIGIYTYFTAFVYVHFYFGAFGLSTQSLKIDYTEYLVYAYDVVSAPLFIFYALALIVLMFLGKIVLSKVFRKRLRGSFSNRRRLLRYRFAGKVFQLVLLFPFFYCTARAIAGEDYLHARMDLKGLKAIQFVFRRTAEGLSPQTQLDSVPLPFNELSGDLYILKRDTSQRLLLLGESETTYMVLNQPPYDTVYHQLPTGYIYAVNKNDILLSRIVLRSQTIK
jgi:hypothetical protein